MDNEPPAAGSKQTDKQDWYLRQAARLLLPSLSVSVHHNLISKANTSWIHCRRRDCDALFQSLKHLLHHEKIVHRIPVARKKGGSALSFGTYKTITLRPTKVNVDRREVEDWLQEQRQDLPSEVGQRILRRQRRKQVPHLESDLILIPEPREDHEDSRSESMSDDDESDEAFNPKRVSTSSIWKRRPKEKPLDRLSFPHACLHCNRRFRLRNTMRAHLRTHHPAEYANEPQPRPRPPPPQVKSRNCSKCDRTFPKLYKLRMHELRNHGGVKSFACTYAPEECAKQFWTSGALKTHVDNIHLRLGRWFHCERCLKVYQTEEKLLAHSKVCLMRMFETKVDEPVAGLPGFVLDMIEAGAGGACRPGGTANGEGDGGLEEPEEDPLALSTETTMEPAQPQAQAPIAPEATPITISATSTSTPTPDEEFILAVEVEDEDSKSLIRRVDIEMDFKDEGTLHQNHTRERRSTDINTTAGAVPRGGGECVKPELEPGEIRGLITFDVDTNPNPTAAVQASQAPPPRQRQRKKKSIVDPSGLLIVMPPKRSGCLTCPACGKVFGKRDHLWAHVQRHNKSLLGKLPCDFPGCGKLLSSQHNLELHRVTHTVATPFKCSYCGLGFKTSHGRKFHERREHTRDFPFKCHFPPCEKSFVAKQQLQIHELRAHTREKNHACRHCDQKFLLKRQLVQHERSHTGEKPLLCAYCGRGFARYNQRSIHQKRHKAMIEKMRAKGMKDAETATKEKVDREKARNSEVTVTMNEAGAGHVTSFPNYQNQNEESTPVKPESVFVEEAAAEVEN